MDTLPKHLGEKKVRLSHELSEGEKLGTSNRKAQVKKCLDKLGIPCTPCDVPNIAILGAGGGLRAMIALQGTLQELQKQGLLDTIMYLCGVSGATWCMSALYKQGDWAEKMETVKQLICDALTKSTWSLPKATQMLLEAAKDENYSLTDFWAYTIIYGMLHELDKSHLSEHRGAAESGNNPYPIYAAVDERSFCKATEYSPATWFEFTPHEASFLGYRASVPMELFGSEFKKGELKNQKEEKILSYLYGLWGSCIGSKEENERFIIELFHNFFKRKMKTSEPFRATADSGQEEDFQGFPAPSLHPEDSDMEKTFQSGTEGPTPYCLSLDTMENSVLEKVMSGVGSAVDLGRMLAKTSYDILHWKWGTTNNFLYKCSGVQAPELVNDKVVSLVDAGIAINCAYPLVLRPERKVQLILSFDYGPGDPFKTLKQAVTYCKDNCIPFPEVDEKLLEDTENPSDCYIFRGEGAPTVMHFPLFNKVNCPGYVTEWRILFTPVRFLYNEKDIHKLLHTASLNVSNNKDKILEEIKHIVARSRKKAGS